MSDNPKPELSNHPKPLRVLHIEDDPRDVRLFHRHLARAGYKLEADVVATASEFVAALQSKCYDVILADHGLPGWSGPGALELLQCEGLDTPFILLTGTLGEDVAVEMIKRGAADYVLKDRPARLFHAIQRALEERSRREEHKKWERSRDLLASIVETSDDAIIGMDAEGNILSWNRGAMNMYGYTIEEVRGRAGSVLFVPTPGETFDQAMASLRRGESVRRYEASGARKDGRPLQVTVTLSPIRESNGCLAAASAIIRDVTQEKQLRQELFAAQKLEAVGRLAAGIAHDFNNLLTVVNGYSSQVLEQLGESGQFRAEIAEINKAGQKAANLTRQLLTFSRKQIRQPKALALNAIVTDMESMLRRLLGAEITIVTRLDPALGTVMADSGQMEQVIMNLAVNAGDAMPLGGTLTIATANVEDPKHRSRTTGAPEQWVTLELSDTGVGMDRETMTHIFEPFFTTKGPGRGTGLGLSTVFGIVEQSGGSVSVESEPGRGSTFEVLLPRVAGKSAMTLPLEPRSVAVDGEGTVLVVEDEEAVLAFISATLERDKYTVLCAANGPEAIELCQRHQGEIGLLITDMVMPFMSGAELAQRVSSMRPEMKILFMSGYADEELIRRAELATPHPAILTKPFGLAELSAKVREILGQ